MQKGAVFTSLITVFYDTRVGIDDMSDHINNIPQNQRNECMCDMPCSILGYCGGVGYFVVNLTLCYHVGMNLALDSLSLPPLNELMT